MNPLLAIDSVACRFPDAASPEEYFENLLAGRRSFRSIPACRLSLKQYAAALVGEADSIPEIEAGLITGWRFDRQSFRIPVHTYENTDYAHWLALDVARSAVERSTGLAHVDKSRVAVVVANTLTGEFSRANSLRLRLPFLRSVLQEAGSAADVEADVLDKLDKSFAAALLSRFPVPQEDSLAGALANTIAGRIANFFDFGGGAYTVDGACASSLLAVADASQLLLSDQADAVIVGAVDLSLDPLELVGFARAGALSTELMRVFDRNATGFWPAEGAGFAVLWRLDRLRAANGSPLACVRGVGISSDGAGGITRPSEIGQLRAYERAYAAAGVSPHDVSFVEAHGTGTQVGDTVELSALSRLRLEAKSPLMIGSVKANIGHAKAAAGFAGLIKTVMSLHRGVVPPHVGCREPHELLANADSRLSLLREPHALSPSAVAGVSGFGFGGINAHVVLERTGAPQARTAKFHAIAPPDAEPFFFAANRAEELAPILERLAVRAASMGRSELVDASSHFSSALGDGRLRVAVLASTPKELADGLATARRAVDNDANLHDAAAGVFVAHGVERKPRIAFLFPGHGASPRRSADVWRARWPWLADIVPEASHSSSCSTHRFLVGASLGALRILRSCGVEADVAIGHSLGELMSLHWAGSISEPDLLALAAARGEAVDRYGASDGAMLRAFSREIDFEAYAAGRIAIACRNGPGNVVFSGPADEVRHLRERLHSAGADIHDLPVRYAFHSEGMRDVAVGLEEAMQSFRLSAPNRPVISTVTGDFIREDPKSLLIEQVTGCVRFFDALQRLGEVDLAVEVGVSTGLAGLAKGQGIECCATDMVCESVRPMLETLAIAFCKGATVNLRPFFQDRHTRTFELALPHFLSNRCAIANDSVPRKLVGPAPVVEALARPASDVTRAKARTSSAGDLLAVVKQSTAAESGLAINQLKDNDRLLSDLHLNSLSVNRIVSRCCSHVGVRPFPLASELSNATLAEVAICLEEHRARNEQVADPDRINGIRPWIRTYQTQWRPATLPEVSDRPIQWETDAIGKTTSIAGNGTEVGRLIWLEDDWNDDSLAGLLQEIGDLSRSGRYHHLAICHSGWPLSGMALSIAAENTFRSLRILEREGRGDCHEVVQRWLAARISGFSELRCTISAHLESPVFVPSPFQTRDLRDLSREDVVLAVGGARGIVAECAFELASRSGSTLVLVGSSPASSVHVVEALARAKQADIQCRYVRCDVRDDETSVKNALDIGLSGLSPPTVLLYGAGANDPCTVRNMRRETAEHALFVKARGLSTLLRCIGSALQRLITYGSLISKIGLQGESHYALANAAQTRIAEQFARARPDCSILNLEWSVWGAIGMGERLGAVTQLARLGVDTLSVNHALEVFCNAIHIGAVGTYAVTSRFGAPRNVDVGAVPAPCLRFVGRPLITYPGVEIVVETHLSPENDSYLLDHQIGGTPVLPGVMVLEAFLQVASCLGIGSPTVCFEAVKFTRAVRMNARGLTKVRIGALRAEDGCVEVSLWCDEDNFTTACASAKLKNASPISTSPPVQASEIDVPAAGLYGSLFLCRGRFARICRIHAATSRRVIAEVSNERNTSSWFGPHESHELLLGDAAVNDAVLHAVQCCMPHRRVIPIEVDNIVIARDAHCNRIVGTERSSVGDDVYEYDIASLDDRGTVTQLWHGVRFRAIGSIDVNGPLRVAPELLVPFLERHARELGSDACRAACVLGEVSRAGARQLLIDALQIGRVIHRGDGKPIAAAASAHTSFSYTAGLAVGLLSSTPIACDVEVIDEHPEASALDHPGVRWTQHETARKLGHLVLGGLSEGRKINDRFANGPSIRSFCLPVEQRWFAVTLRTQAGEPAMSYPRSANEAHTNA